MYYNSNKSNNDYYNSYKKEVSELEAYRKEEVLEKIMTVLLSIIALILFFLATFFLYKYFNPVLDLNSSFIHNKKELEQNSVLKNIVIREEELPKSIQPLTQDISPHKEVVSSINEKDIALIVQIIMSQINSNIKKTKIEKPLEEQLHEVTNQKFVTKNLNKVNHYNKIVLTKNEVLEVKNASLIQLSTSLSNIVNENMNTKSNYTQEIKKEVLFRENEMRIIIVQKGDTLSKIARKAYGNSNDYQKIFSANPEIIKNANQIFVGQRLRIPS